MMDEEKHGVGFFQVMATLMRVSIPFFQSVSAAHEFLA
jgi:hypothetical protein